MKVIQNFKLADLLSATDIAKTPGGKIMFKGVQSLQAISSTLDRIIQSTEIVFFYIV